MKKIIMTAIMSIALLFCAGDSNAQDTTVKFDAASKTNVAYFGGMYETSFHGLMGTGQKLGIGNLWSFETAQIGVNKIVNVDLVYFLVPNTIIPQIPANLQLGLVAGPDANWMDNVGDDKPALLYLTASTGGVLNYAVTEKYGLWAHGKYIFTNSDSEQLDGKWRFAGGMSFFF